LTGKAISFNSSRGGTGKTIMAVNLAALFANEGRNVILIELDFRAPSIFHIFKEAVKETPTYWVNDYLNSRCKPGDFLIDVHNIFNTKGKLSLGCANPSIYAIEDMVRKSRLWEANALKKLFNLKDFSFSNLGADICIYDTSPGIQYSSLNAIISSDLIVFVSSSDSIELEGVGSILKEFDDVFRNKTFIVLNKVFPETDCWSNDKDKEYARQISKDFKVPVIGLIPCYCDILKANRNQLLTFTKPNHPFVMKLEEISQKIVSGW